MRLVWLAGLAFGLVMALVIGWMQVRATVRPLGQAVQIAGTVAAGDLTQRIEVTSQDETGRVLLALKDMNAALVQIVTRVAAAPTRRRRSRPANRSRPGRQPRTGKSSEEAPRAAGRPSPHACNEAACPTAAAFFLARRRAP